MGFDSRFWAAQAQNSLDAILHLGRLAGNIQNLSSLPGVSLGTNFTAFSKAPCAVDWHAARQKRFPI